MKILISIISLFTLIISSFTTFGFYAHKEFVKYKAELEEKKLFRLKKIF